MAFAWDNYPTAQDSGTNNTTGRPAVDPSQLQYDPTQATDQGPYNSGTGPIIKNGDGSFTVPGVGSMTADHRWIPDPTAGNISAPSTPSPSSPLGGGGGINPGGAATPLSGQDPQAFFNQLFPGDTLTPDMLTQNEQALKAQGIELVRNAAGVPGKIKLPNGQVIDVIQGAGSGMNKKQWLTGDAWGGAASPYGSLGFGDFTKPFTAPTAQDALNSPGLQFGLDEANRMMQNSAAAKGTLLNGRVVEAENKAN